MRLVLVRHGEAEAPRGSDAERALTPRGAAQARSTGEWLAAQLADVAPGEAVLLTSPYRRAQQTAAALNECLQLPLHTVAVLTPDDDPRQAFAVVAARAQDRACVLVVSHMPLVASLCSWLTEGVWTAGQGFALAEVRVLEAAVPGPGTAALRMRFVPSC